MNLYRQYSNITVIYSVNVIKEVADEAASLIL
jgi:hypothetical protein